MRPRHSQVRFTQDISRRKRCESIPKGDLCARRESRLTGRYTCIAEASHDAFNPLRAKREIVATTDVDRVLVGFNGVDKKPRAPNWLRLATRQSMCLPSKPQRIKILEASTVRAP